MCVGGLELCGHGADSSAHDGTLVASRADIHPVAALRVASYEGPWAVRDRGGRETTGQVVCMIVAGPGSLVGRFPLGNAGRWTTTITEAAALSSDPDAHPPDRASERQPVDEERVLFGRWTRSSSSCRRRILSRSVRVQIPSK